MPVRSHVDLGLFVVFLHVPPEQITPGLLTELDRVKGLEGERFEGVAAALPPRARQIVFHEHYHFWQGLRLPFVFRYALLSYRIMFLAFGKLARANSEYHDWDCVLPQMGLFNLKDRAGFKVDTLYYVTGEDWGRHRAEIPEDLAGDIIFGPVDMLECATSLSEFFYMTPLAETTNPLALSRWAKRNPSFLVPFDFAAAFLGDRATAMRLCLPLINAAFHTSHPTRAFIELLGRCWDYLQTDNGRQFLAQREPCPWHDLSHAMLDQLKFEALPDKGGDLLGTKFHRLTLDQWVGAKYSGQLGHPGLATAARRWTELEREEPRLANVMDQPQFAGREVLDALQDGFAPPLIIISLHLPDGTDRVLLTSHETNAEDPFRSKHGVSFKGFMSDALTMYGAVRRASGAHFDYDQRTCGHKLCPEYPWNFCNSYPVVPADHERCGFKKRLEGHIERERARHVNDQD